MLIRFDTDVGGFTTFRDVAVALIRMTGHSGAIPGAILAADVPTALGRLEAALAAEPAGAPAREEDEEGEPPVTVRQRAFPLVELLRDAARNDSSVRWREA
jgi:hypothetical protein